MAFVVKKNKWRIPIYTASKEPAFCNVHFTGIVKFIPIVACNVCNAAAKIKLFQINGGINPSRQIMTFTSCRRWGY